MDASVGLRDARRFQQDCHKQGKSARNGRELLKEIDGALGGVRLPGG
jgi:hypothetical protein